MATTKWGVDPVHTDITFKVKHLMITTVTGRFKQYTVEVETEGDDFSNAKKLNLLPISIQLTQAMSSVMHI